MGGIFDGLEKFGLGEYKKVELFEPDKKATDKGVNVAEKQFNIKDCIYTKEFVCPVCGKTFGSNIIRTGKVKLENIEYDLRPIYSPIEPLFYDNIVCVKCGYSTVKQMFANIRDSQIDLILNQLTPKFTPITYPDELTIDMAIERYKLTLLNTYIKKGKNGEKAYVCMKLCWLFRIKGDKESELLFAKHTRDGFIKAFSTEVCPIMGLEENTVIYIIAAFSRTLKEYEDSLRFLGRVIVSKTASSRLKDRARDLRDEINAIKNSG